MKDQVELSSYQVVSRMLNERRQDLRNAKAELEAFVDRYDDMAYDHQQQMKFDSLVFHRDMLNAQVSQLISVLGALCYVPGAWR